VVLEPGSINKLVRTMDNPDIGIAGMKLVFPTEKQLIAAELVTGGRPPQKLQHIGLASTVRGKVGHLFSGWSANHPKVNAMSKERKDGSFRDPMAVTGAALMTRRKIFSFAGMFWEGYGNGCLTGDSYVFTGEGLVQMKDLVKHESYTEYAKIGLASMDGYDYAKLTVNNGEQETIKIETSKRYSLAGTFNHKLIVMNTDGMYDWKELQDINVDDYVAVRCGANVWGDRWVNPDFAYLLGLYTSEGSCEDHKRITITNSSKEVQDFLADAKFSREKDGLHFRQSGQIIDLFEEFGVDLSQKALNKTIPSFILKSKKDVVVAYLQGLFDGDGCAKKNGWVTYSSSSLELIKQVQMLLVNFGIVAGIHAKKISNKRLRTGYTLELGTDSHLFYNYIGFRIVRKQNRFNLLNAVRSDVIPHQRKLYKKLYGMMSKDRRQYKKFGFHSSNPCRNVRRDTISELLWNRKELSHTKEFKQLKNIAELDYIWLKVKSKESAGIQQTYDLHVPSSHSYIANGFVVHNTWEDVDYCLTVKEMGKRVAVVPESVGVHYTGATATQQNIGFPMGENYQKFILRWRDRLKQTDIDVL